MIVSVSGKYFLALTCPRPFQIWFVRNSKAFDTVFNQKSEELIWKKALKFVLLDNYFPDLFFKGVNKDIKSERKFCRQS